MTFAKLLVVGAFLASALDLSGSNSRSEKVKGSDIPASAEIPKNAYEMGCYKPLRRLVVELHSFPSNESLIGAIRRCKLTANIDVDLAKKALTDASLRATCIPGRRKKIKGGSFASDVMSAKVLRNCRLKLTVTFGTVFLEYAALAHRRNLYHNAYVGELQAFSGAVCHVTIYRMQE
eukprot:1123891-Amorphochlora_amoeboformis.AAC.2